MGLQERYEGTRASGTNVQAWGTNVQGGAAVSSVLYSTWRVYAVGTGRRGTYSRVQVKHLLGLALPKSFVILLSHHNSYRCLLSRTLAHTLYGYLKERCAENEYPSDSLHGLQHRYHATTPR